MMQEGRDESGHATRSGGVRSTHRSSGSLRHSFRANSRTSASLSEGLPRRHHDTWRANSSVLQSPKPNGAQVNLAHPAGSTTPSLQTSLPGPQFKFATNRDVSVQLAMSSTTRSSPSDSGHPSSAAASPTVAIRHNIRRTSAPNTIPPLEFGHESANSVRNLFAN